MQTAFVTGAAGFLGRHLVEALLARGAVVVALVRRAPPPWMVRDDLFVRRGDLTDREAIRAAMPEGVDAVFHVAGNTSSWRGHAAELARDNVEATSAVVEVALERHAKRFVLTSTAGVFGFHDEPFTESADLRGAGTGSPYLQTKAEAEQVVLRAVQRGLQAVILNPGHIIGAYDEHGWASLFDQAMAGELGRSPPGRASFCAARAVAAAHVAAAERGQAGERYLLGGADATYLEFFRGITDRVGARPPRGVLPGVVLLVVAMLSEWVSRFTRKAPTLTRGLASILTGDLRFSSHRAIVELGYQPTTLDAMLDDLGAWWTSRARPLAPPSPHTAPDALGREAGLKQALRMGAVATTDTTSSVGR